MQKKLFGLIITIAFLMSMGILAGQGVSNNLPSKAEYSVALTYFYGYNSNYKTTDHYITGTTFDLSFIDGFQLEKDDTVLDITGSTWESDDINLKDGVTLYDRSEYSLTFLNATYNSATEANSTRISTTSNMAVSGRETTGSATAGTAYDASSVYWESNLYFDQNGDGDYVDALDKAYLPLSGTEYFYVCFSNNFNTSVNAATYGEISLHFEMTSGTDYVIYVRGYYGNGDAGWSSVGSTADNQAIFSVYDGDGLYIALQIPLADLLSEDENEVGSVLGLDLIRTKMNFGATDEAITLTAKNIAVFDSYLSLTDKYDDDNDFDFRSSGGIISNPWDDNDIIATTITESTTDTIDNTMPLLADYSGSFTLSKNARFLKFTGVCSIQPSTYSYSSASSEGLYLTTENIVFDTRGIDDLDTLSNVLSWSTLKFNITIDDAVLHYTSDYEDNLVSFVVEGLDKKSTFESSWSASTVTDDSEIQYDVDDPSTTTGSYQEISLGYYTQSVYSSTTATTGGGGGVTTTSSNDMTMIYVVVGLVALVTLWYLFVRKDNKRRR
ncbi:MAG: hypothetical protein AB1782_16665 [Cyanobacteriota bacterium]